MGSNAAGTGKTVTVRLEAAETGWEIAPGHVVPGYGFNGQVPGPAIEAEVGDTLVVDLTNALHEPTSIHWHGLRVPAEMDGTQLVQQPIQPGKTFQYRFALPDAGTFWYHPHINETVQLEKGLYGALSCAATTSRISTASGCSCWTISSLTARATSPASGASRSGTKAGGGTPAW
jgi:FtsP/CotA-like multicopper oxidase with cupredoxin domain